MNDIQKTKPNQIVDVQAQRIVDFLTSAGLPAENIIATAAEREVIGNNLPAFIEGLPAEIKKDARYLSKFVVGAGYGLFDYSLNSIWNEVVIDLRKRQYTMGWTSFLMPRLAAEITDTCIRPKQIWETLKTQSFSTLAENWN